MTNAPHVSLAGERLTVGSFGNVLFMHIHGLLTLEDLVACHQVHLELITRVSGGTGVLAIADHHTPIPGADVRDASSRLMRELAPHLLAAGTVIEGGGFWASAVRSFLSAIYFVAKQPCPTKAFATVNEGCGWLGPRVGQIPSQLLGAAEHVLKQPRSALRKVAS